MFDCPTRTNTFKGPLLAAMLAQAESKKRAISETQERFSLSGLGQENEWWDVDMVWLRFGFEMIRFRDFGKRVGSIARDTGAMTTCLHITSRDLIFVARIQNGLILYQ